MATRQEIERKPINPDNIFAQSMMADIAGVINFREEEALAILSSDTSLPEERTQAEEFLGSLPEFKSYVESYAVSVVPSEQLNEKPVEQVEAREKKKDQDSFDPAEDLLKVITDKFFKEFARTIYDNVYDRKIVKNERHTEEVKAKVVDVMRMISLYEKVSGNKFPIDTILNPLVGKDEKETRKNKVWATRIVRVFNQELGERLLAKLAFKQNGIKDPKTYAELDSDYNKMRDFLASNATALSQAELIDIPDESEMETERKFWEDAVKWINNPLGRGGNEDHANEAIKERVRRYQKPGRYLFLVLPNTVA